MQNRATFLWDLWLDLPIDSTEGERVTAQLDFGTYLVQMALAVFRMNT